MPSSDEAQLQTRIRDLLSRHRVVLFMKGSPAAPQCGFSAEVVEILEEYELELHTVDVLADAELREGVKVFAQWPTIPQLYVEGEFMGGADIIREQHASRELAETLGHAMRELRAPKIEVLPAAVAAFEAAAAEMEGDEVLRLSIDARFYNDLSIGSEADGDLVAEAGALRIHFDRRSARRAEGLSIDFVENEEGAGFKITNPNAPPELRRLAPKELQAKIKAGDSMELVDVRNPEEIEIAPFPGARRLDADYAQELQTMPKDRVLVFVCHHGVRSRAAAEGFLGMGFREVFDLEGGVDAWAQSVEPGFPRY